MEIHNNASRQQIQSFLTEIECNFEPPLSQRLNILEYAGKLSDKAQIICYKEEERIISAILYYIDNEKKTAYIPVLGSVDGFEGRGLMRVLMDKVEETLLASDFCSLGLETWLGSRALNIYIKRGFYVSSITEQSEINRINVTLYKDLKKSFPVYEFPETPLEINPRLNSELGVNVYIKRDDLFPVVGGGSKARKLKFILKKAVDNGCTAVVTAGSNYSNHLRATAVMCAELGLKFTACIHDEKPGEADIRGNLKLTLDLSYKHHFVQMKDIKSTMDNAINRYILDGEKPFYIWGGGHSIEGTFSYYNAMQTVIQQIDVIPDYVFLASGTGTTQAGILLGVKSTQINSKVIGVSVARDEKRGKEAIKEAIQDIHNYLPISTVDGSDIKFDDGFLMGGYGKSTKKLDYFLQDISRKFGLVLDPIYSGKAFYCLWDYVKSGRIKPGENVVFWNTGGVLNII